MNILKKSLSVSVAALMTFSLWAAPVCMAADTDTAAASAVTTDEDITIIPSGASAEEIQGEIYNRVGKGGTIKLRGEYTFEQPIVLYGGQTLDASDAVITSNCEEYAVSPYYNNQNIRITGGTWNISSGYFAKMSRCSDITFDSVTVNGGGSFDYGNIFSYMSDRVTVKNCTINNSAENAVYAYKSTDFTVVGTKVNKCGGHGIRIFSCDNILLAGNTLDGICGDGMNISTCEKTGTISGNMIKNVTVNSKLDIDPVTKEARSGCGIAVSKCNNMKIGSSGAFEGTIYTGNNIAGCAADGIHLNITNGTLIENTVFSYISGDGIHNSASKETAVQNCSFKIIKGSGISFVPGPVASVALDNRQGKNSVIRNNKIDTTNEYGILLSKTDGMTVNENTINNCKNYGIVVNSCSNSKLLANNITKTKMSGNSGVSVTNDCKNVVVVNNSDVKLSLDKTSISLGKSESYTLKAALSPEAYPDKTITWQSSDKNIADVNNGRIIAKSVGTAVVTAKSKSGASASCKVNVLNAPGSVSLTKSAVSIGVGEKFSISSVLPSGCAAAARWYSSSDSSVVKMTKTYWTGEFIGQKVGTAVVKVTLYNGKTASCRVNVMAAPSSVSLPKKSLTIGVGESYSFGAVLPKDTASASRVYSSTNNYAVKMTKTSWTAAFTGVRPGSAKVLVKLYNGKTAECTVYVKAAPKSVSLNKKEMTLKVGQTASLSAVLPANTGSAERIYKTNNSSVVKLLSTSWVCNFKALKPGSAIISVRLYNGRSAICKITVVK